MCVVGVIGSRRWSSALRSTVVSWLTQQCASAVVTGTAFGADQCAKEAADELRLPVTRIMARWWTPDAARERNRLIFARAEHLLVLWDGRSVGTRAALELARAEFAHVPLTVYVVGA